jgi:hypothetical protein
MDCGVRIRQWPQIWGAGIPNDHLIRLSEDDQAAFFAIANIEPIARGGISGEAARARGAYAKA